jgi:hypothetical protein
MRYITMRTLVWSMLPEDQGGQNLRRSRVDIEGNEVDLGWLKPIRVARRKERSRRRSWGCPCRFGGA